MSRFSQFQLVLCVCLFGAATLVWAQQERLTNKDVIEMHRAGLGDSFLIAAIKRAKARSFDLTPRALELLEAAGVSRAVRAAMLATAPTPPPPTPTPTPPPTPIPPPPRPVATPTPTPLPPTPLPPRAVATSAPTPAPASSQQAPPTRPLVTPTPARSESPFRARPPDPQELRAPLLRDLEIGVRQVERMSFDAARVTLEGVARRLEEMKKGPDEDLARAYLYVGTAHAGLGNDVAAVNHFKSALENNPSVRPAATLGAHVESLFTVARSGGGLASPPTPVISTPPLPRPSAALPAPRPSAAAAGARWVNPKDGLEYVRIPEGAFMMGCTVASKCAADEAPRHRVVLSKGLWVSRTEATVASFQAFVRETQYQTLAERQGWAYVWDNNTWVRRPGAGWQNPGFPQDPRHPVVAVSWDDASAFCRWSGGRLPTEVEWEYAARGGIDGQLYPWGNEASECGGARKRANAGACLKGTETAASNPANGYGLFDVIGNAWEWTADWYAEKEYSSRAAAATDPQGPASGVQRIARGAAWSALRDFTRLSYRARLYPGIAQADVGFRCVRDGAGSAESRPR